VDVHRALPPEWLESYHNLRDEIRHQEAKEDPAARLEKKRREKHLTRAVYKWLKHKRR
jgi:hypothetical protein